MEKDMTVWLEMIQRRIPQLRALALSLSTGCDRLERTIGQGESVNVEDLRGSVVGLICCRDLIEEAIGEIDEYTVGLIGTNAEETPTGIEQRDGGRELYDALSLLIENLEDQVRLCKGVRVDLDYRDDGDTQLNLQMVKKAWGETQSLMGRVDGMAQLVLGAGREG